MILSAEQIIEKIKAPVNKAFIENARKQEERLIMHTEPIQSEGESPEALRDFLKWVGSFLPADKMVRFKQLVVFPLETVDSTESIFDELSKVFDTPDKYIKTEFSNPAFERDFMEYTAGLNNNDGFWENKGFDALKNAINSFVVVDISVTDPLLQQTLRPEPYYYLLSIRSVLDVEINEATGKVEYIIFSQKDGSIVAIEESAYRRFSKPEQADEWILNFENPHALGYVPVEPFYRHAIKGSRGINKRSPITNSLSKLDWLLFWKTSKKYLDLYGAYPIVVHYEDECNYQDKEGNGCREGYINSEYPDASAAGGYCKTQTECPACKSRGLIGPGSDWKITPPKDKDEADLMNNAIKFIEPSNDKLTYGVDELNRLEKEIFINSVGYYQEATKEAINEKQVQSQFEARKAILNRIREQYELNIKFCLETMARLRYGNYFSHCTATLGSEHFLQSAEDLVEQYVGAKKAGMPAYEIARIRETYSRTKFKNNQAQFQRTFILSQLEPYPDFTVSELKNLGISDSDSENFLLKLDFNNFIAKFEREQMNIVEFGSLIDFGAKIEKIKAKLMEYVKAARAAAVKVPVETPVV